MHVIVLSVGYNITDDIKTHGSYRPQQTGAPAPGHTMARRARLRAHLRSDRGFEKNRSATQDSDDTFQETRRLTPNNQVDREPGEPRINTEIKGCGQGADEVRGPAVMSSCSPQHRRSIPRPRNQITKEDILSPFRGNTDAF